MTNSGLPKPTAGKHAREVRKVADEVWQSAGRSTPEHYAYALKALYTFCLQPGAG